MKVLKSIRFDSEVLASIEEMATAKQMSLANIIRTAVDFYLEKEKLAAELNDVEARIAASLLRAQKETYRVGEDVQLLIAYLDQLAKFVFFATPEVIDREAAAAVGNRRHAAFIADLPNAFSSARKKAVVAETLESMEGNDA